jgi:hypothetical protein
LIRRRTARVAVACSVALLLGEPGFADARDDAVLAPQLDIVVLPRELLAIDAEGGGQLAVRLELGEQVLYAKQRGRVGVAVTDRRMLAVAASSGSWQEARYRRGESPPADVTLGDRVALFLTPVRAIGFDGKSGNLVESVIGPREAVQDSVVGQNLAVVVTSRRALGVSAARGGFFEAKLRVGEHVEDISALANVVTLRTSQRLLLFRGPTGSWEERRLPIR